MALRSWVMAPVTTLQVRVPGCCCSARGMRMATV